MKNKYFILIAIAVSLSACKNNTPVPDKNEAFEKELQEKFINAHEGDIIELPEGTFYLNRSLVLDGIKNITIRGKGTNKTILSFKQQKEGAEGLRITADGVTMEDFAVVDTKGDGIKVQDADNVTFRRIKVGWAALHDSRNGSYGLYPVGCTGILLEDCEISGAIDAGIYVSQSKDIIARRNNLHDNVAGIEIENSTYADVYENLIENNSAGLLLFALPGLAKKNAGRCRVFNNRIFTNNTANFGVKGNIVSDIPAGAGVVVMADKQVEIFNNDLSGQNTFSMAVISYLLLQKPFTDSLYNAYSGGISVHDNKVAHGTGAPDISTGLGKLFSEILGAKMPDILYDGVINPTAKNTDGTPKESERICIRNNGNATFGNLDFPNKGKNHSSDISKFNCSLPSLTEIKLN